MTGGPGDPSPEADSGLARHLRASTRELLSYLQARVQLFALESREAYANFGGRTLFWVIGGGLVFIGYLLVLTASVPLLATRFDVPWHLVCFALAALHLVSGAVLFYIAHRRFTSLYYEATLNELEKDRRWLAQDPPTSPPRRPN